MGKALSGQIVALEMRRDVGERIVRFVKGADMEKREQLKFRVVF